MSKHMDDFYSVGTEPAEQPVTLNETKLFLRVDGDGDDTLITALIKAATIKAEKYTGRFFVERTVTASFSGADVTRCERFPFLKLRRAPLVSITSFEAIVDDTLTTVDADSYQLKQTSSFARILLTESITADDVPYPLVVVALVGYGKAKVVPDSIKDAIKMLVAFYYENRGDVEPDGKVGMPWEVKSVLSPYKIIDTF
jgi:uncharacterized phiE125 gp8 family phage protein